jgi:hypothetical protein
MVLPVPITELPRVTYDVNTSGMRGYAAALHQCRYIMDELHFLLPVPFHWSPGFFKSEPRNSEMDKKAKQKSKPLRFLFWPWFFKPVSQY